MKHLNLLAIVLLTSCKNAREGVPLEAITSTEINVWVSAVCISLVFAGIFS